MIEHSIGCPFLSTKLFKNRIHFDAIYRLYRNHPGSLGSLRQLTGDCQDHGHQRQGFDQPRVPDYVPGQKYHHREALLLRQVRAFCGRPPDHQLAVEQPAVAHEAPAERRRETRTIQGDLLVACREGPLNSLSAAPSAPSQPGLNSFSTFSQPLLTPVLNLFSTWFST